MEMRSLHLPVRILSAGMLLAVLFPAVYCSSGSSGKQDGSKKDTILYLNHSDTARYVGMDQCRLCHFDKFSSFAHTGMGLSFDKATQKKSSARFEKHTVVYDKHSDFYYYPFWDRDSTMNILEFRLNGRDTVYKRLEKVNYVVGSGQHTNSHIQDVNGYLNQMPLTFYTQQGRWDLPPGFENGMNTRFTRRIGLECMSCHNALPDFLMGSENKYNHVPLGIDCERCHGPGSIHVQMKSAGILVDTSKQIDYSIVNPGKLPVELQFDLCQRCHLQGNAVLREGKSFFDFKPGMKLSDVMTVFLPKYSGADDEFIMASHADRLKMSKCFTESFEAGEKNSLRPYKSALTCVTCHDPHVSVKATGKEVFNNACKKCHGSGAETICTENLQVRKKKGDNCVSCHMTGSGSIDIPHVTVTDHFIRKPLKIEELKKVKKFIGLYAINEPNPPASVKARAYLNQYEKFDARYYYLDSAEKYLPDRTPADIRNNFHSLVQLRLLKKEYVKIYFYVNALKADTLLQKMLIRRSYDNQDAWTAYRIGEAYHMSGDIRLASRFYSKADELAPYYPEFKNKHAVSLMELKETEKAKTLFEAILAEDARHVSALTNLGYIYLVKGNDKKAEELYGRGLAIDPDYEPLLMNKAGLFVYRRQFKEAEKVLYQILKKNPRHSQAKAVLESLQNI